VFNQTIIYRIKKVVGVFVRFRAANSSTINHFDDENID
jgi:hypothetical protein